MKKDSKENAEKNWGLNCGKKFAKGFEKIKLIDSKS
jgi:hypothetical protein